MKYVFLTVAALAVCFGVSYLLARLLRRHFSDPRKKLKTFAVTFLGGIILILLIGLGYMSIYARAGEQAKAALQGNDTVTVSEINGGWFFDGPSETEAIVFYPGAKVDSAAYAPLMLRLAEKGYDCFLAEMPFHFALLDSDAADTFISAYSYDTWLMAGHSMGGMTAAAYASAHADIVDGVILLAAYPAEDIADGMKLCSIYGSEDGCLERNVYSSSKSFWPSGAMEAVIDGGNHALFGDYGEQKGDGSALITGEAQQAFTAETIADYFG